MYKYLTKEELRAEFRAYLLDCCYYPDDEDTDAFLDSLLSGGDSVWLDRTRLPDETVDGVRYKADAYCTATLMENGTRPDEAFMFCVLTRAEEKAGQTGPLYRTDGMNNLDFPDRVPKDKEDIVYQWCIMREDELEEAFSNGDAAAAEEVLAGLEESWALYFLHGRLRPEEEWIAYFAQENGEPAANVRLAEQWKKYFLPDPERFALAVAERYACTAFLEAHGHNAEK